MLDPIPKQIAEYCDEPEPVICCEYEMGVVNDEFGELLECDYCGKQIVNGEVI